MATRLPWQHNPCSTTSMEAHSKLKRLLNEAERQRRRRERLRTEPKSLQPPRDEGIMTALKSCTRFQDFVRELNTLGFSLTHHDEDTCEGENHTYFL
ncbi:UNVERIFIED_CONTAM: hypothetical protein NCL1_43110 [Trichonephila clavipes]